MHSCDSLHILKKTNTTTVSNPLRYLYWHHIHIHNHTSTPEDRTEGNAAAEQNKCCICRDCVHSSLPGWVKWGALCALWIPHLLSNQIQCWILADDSSPDTWLWIQFSLSVKFTADAARLCTHGLGLGVARTEFWLESEQGSDQRRWGRAPFDRYLPPLNYSSHQHCHRYQQW